MTQVVVAIILQVVVRLVVLITLVIIVVVAMMIVHTENPVLPALLVTLIQAVAMEAGILDRRPVVTTHHLVLIRAVVVDLGKII